MKREQLRELADRVLKHAAAAGCDLRETGQDRWRGRCPLCAKDNLTLQVRLDEEGLFLSCWHASCDAAVILEAFGLTWTDLRLRTETNSASKLVRRPFSQIKIEPIRFLVPDRVPLQGVTLVAGDPFAGKSTWTAHVVGGLTTGRYGEPAMAAWINAEDSAGSVSAPRLKAAGANRPLVEELTIEQLDGTKDVITLPDDVPKLEVWVLETGARLLVLDPLGSFLSTATDSHSDSSFRRALASLAAMADRHHIAVIVVAHMNKDEQKQLLYRIGGSIGLVGLARSLLLFVRDPEDSDGEHGDRRLLAHAGSNWARRVKTLRYLVEEVTWEEDGKQIKTTRLVPQGESELMAEDLIGKRRNGEPSKVELAEKAVCAALASGPRLSSEVREEVEQEVGCGHATIERAAARLRLAGVLGTDGSTSATRWFLLSNDSPHDSPQNPHTREEGSCEESSNLKDTPYIGDTGEGDSFPPHEGRGDEGSCGEPDEASSNGSGGAHARARFEEELRRREQRR